ncbi:unnamed protein product, partial [Tilletia controversa]
MRNAAATTVIERIHALQEDDDNVSSVPVQRSVQTGRSQALRPSIVALRSARSKPPPVSVPTPLPPSAAENRRRFTPNALKPASSSLRPEVLATQRLIRWRPITALTGKHLSSEEIAVVGSALAASYSEDTLGSYGTGLARWHLWCDEREAPEQLRCPAPAELLESSSSSM